MSGRWVSVTERLPICGEGYVLFGDPEDPHFGEYRETRDFGPEGEGWFCRLDCCLKRGKPGRVTDVQNWYAMEEAPSPAALPPEDGERARLAAVVEHASQIMHDELPINMQYAPAGSAKLRAVEDIIEDLRAGAALFRQPPPPPAAGVSKEAVKAAISYRAAQADGLICGFDLQKLLADIEALPDAAPRVAAAVNVGSEPETLWRCSCGWIGTDSATWIALPQNGLTARCPNCGAPSYNLTRADPDPQPPDYALSLDEQGDLALRVRQMSEYLAGSPEEREEALESIRRWAKQAILAERNCDAAGWRCECGDWNRAGEGFCYWCGAGRPDLDDDAAAPPSGVDREAVLEQLADLLNNEACSCAGTPEHPCPRCIVSIEQARELLIKAGWEHELAAARAVPEAKPAARPLPVTDAELTED